jgi:integral membrane protein
MNKATVDANRFFHQTGHIEGWSFIVLMLVAVPLKYLAGWPLGVRIMGTLHGFLFVVFMFAIVQAIRKAGLTFKGAVGAFLLSLIPFGTFYLHKVLPKE